MFLKKRDCMKNFRSITRYSLLLVLVLLSLPVCLQAIDRHKDDISPEEFHEMLENSDAKYVYLGKESSDLYNVISRIHTLENNEDSLLRKLQKHIEDGFSVGLHEAIVETLEYAEKVLKAHATEMNSQEMQNITDSLEIVINQVINDALNIDTEKINRTPIIVPAHEHFVKPSATSSKFGPRKDHKIFRTRHRSGDKVQFNTEVDIHGKLKVYGPAEFKEDVIFEDDVLFEDKVRFKDKVTFEHFVKFEGYTKFKEDVTIEETLTVSDLVVLSCIDNLCVTNLTVIDIIVPGSCLDNLCVNNLTVTDLIVKSCIDNLCVINLSVTELAVASCIDNLCVNNLSVGDIVISSCIDSLCVDNLSVVNETVTNLSATNAFIQNLSVGEIIVFSCFDTLCVNNLSVVNETVTNLSATNAVIQNLSVTDLVVLSCIDNLCVTNLSATNAVIDNLSVTELVVLSCIDSLCVNNLSVTNFVASTIDAVCNLSVGCDIFMVNSTDFAHGNIIKGANSFIHNFGTDNTFVGINAGNFIMTGTENVGVGRQALFSNTTGFENIAIGGFALPLNTIGENDIAIGAFSLSSNTTGNENTAVGGFTLATNTTGSGNTAVGFDAGFSLAAGDNNVLLGTNAGLILGNGFRNIIIGYNSGLSLTSGNDNIYIANAGVASESGIIRIGTVATHTETFIQGIFGSVVGGTGLEVFVDASGQLGTVVSSSRFKHDIEGMTSDISENIYNLRPVTFVYNSDETDTRQYGLIAEEVDQVLPALVVHDEAGVPYTVRYHLLPMLLLNEVQKLHDIVEDQTATIAALKADNKKFGQIIDTVLTRINRLNLP
jgi:Chaperone of endosialidase